MKMTSEDQVAVERLADDSYVVTHKSRSIYEMRSESFDSEGAMLAAVLRRIVPPSWWSGPWERREKVFEIVERSTNDAIEQEL